MAQIYVPGFTRLLLGGLVPSVLPKEVVEEALKTHPKAGYIPGLGGGSKPDPDPDPDPDPEPEPFDGQLAFVTDEDTLTAAFNDATGDPVASVATWVGHYTWAANKWNEFLYWNADVVTDLQQESKEGADWVGMVPKTIEFANEKPGKPGVVASCGPRDIWSGSGVKFYPAKLALNLYTKWVGSLSDSDWRLVMFHEMGHAIGIGTLWSPELENNGSVPPNNHLLDGESYPKTLAAFNTLQVGDGRNMDGNTQIPLHDPDDAHWDDESRLVGSFNYGGFPNEVMAASFETGQDLVISELTVENPRDFGWERRTDDGAGSTQTPEIKMLPPRGRSLRRLIRHSIPERIRPEHIRGSLDEA